MIHNTTWRDDESIYSNQTANNTWLVLAAYESPPTTTNHKSTSVIHAMPSTLDISPTKYTMLNICTGTVQNGTRANKNITDKKKLLVAYANIKPYPIGGAKV